MADVRLTATNPEDSSVVPVACDASGRLLLEEMPPAFDGTVDGDLTVTGKGTFAAGKSIIGNDGSAQFAQGAVDIYANGKVEFTQDVTFDGSAEFAGNVEIGEFNASGTSTSGLRLGSNGTCSFQKANTSNIFQFFRQDKRTFAADSGCRFYLGTDIDAGNQERTSNIVLDGSNGSGTFAGGRAGFTAEGYLWCTTRRGDTVILDATSNGLASWVEYTPTTRLEDIRDKLDANRGDTGEMPADTQ